MLTNRGSMYRLDKCMQSVGVMLSNPRAQDHFFNENDIDVIVDCCLRELSAGNSSRARI